jgi:hypothetical protein
MNITSKNILKEIIKTKIRDLLLIEQKSLIYDSNKFYLMGNFINHGDTNTVEQLKQHYLEGIRGISSHKFVVYDYMQRRDFGLVMDKNEFLKINENNIVKFDYDDIDSFFHNNMYLFKRLLSRETSDTLYVIKTIFSEYIEYIRQRSRRGDKYENLRFITELYDYDKHITKSFSEFNNRIDSDLYFRTIIDDVIEWSMSEDFISKNKELYRYNLYESVDNFLKEKIKKFEIEQEWAVLSNRINIPQNSKIIVFIDKHFYEKFLVGEFNKFMDGKYVYNYEEKLVKFQNIKDIQDAGYKVLFIDPSSTSERQVKYYGKIYNLKNKYGK